jgi:aminodeoxyfutalosine synthase
MNALHPLTSDDLATIAQKSLNGQRLSKEDGLTLLRSKNLLAMGEIARAVKKQKTGDRVFFNVNCHINLTNICVSRCKFCAFSCDPQDDRAYTLALDAILEKARTAAPTGITEFHIVSGLHPDLPFGYYLEVVQKLKQNFPDVHIQAFTAVEIKYFADISGLSIKEVLLRLKDAGLGSLPGGGAEVFSSRLREELCPKKASGEEWLQIMRTAHNLGLRSNATMLYGHIETDEEIIEHFIRLRVLQDETGGFQSFIPLPFHPRHTQMEDFQKPTAYEELKLFCIARLMLDNFDHIKAFWIMVGLKTAQLALEFGVDDLDGTEDLIKMIQEVGMIPVERDTLYNELRIYQKK